MRLDAIGCLRRAIANSRANWELLLAHWVFGAAGLLLLVAGCLPLVWIFADQLPAVKEILGGDPARVFENLGGLDALTWPGWGRFLAAVGLATLLWTVSFLVFCFFYAATYGTLMAGERQAPRGAAPAPWRAFRTFEARNFIGWGRRYVWRYFWAVQLFFAIATAWLLGFVLVVFAAVWAGQGWGAAAGIGIGCGGSLPLVFLGFVQALWFAIAAADLARERSGVWIALRNGLAWLGRRPGTVLSLFLLQLAASLAVSMVFAPISMVGSFATLGAPGADWAMQLALGAMQWMVSTVVALVTSAAYVTFVRDCAEEGDV